ncbi:MAG TPA: DNA recombination protein RmuC [Candidatus Omnitrophota bacterium]|nr:DNA recombination protein RmuC [Candidatus Omnitrophota bacterium]
MMTIIGFFLATAFLAAVFFALTAYLRKQIRQEVKESQEQFLQLAGQQFQAEQNKAALELETRKQMVESSVQGLKEQLEQYQQMLRDLERDRAQKYGNLENELKNASLSTAKLQEATNNLNNILGNNQRRGQWGERMAEDIIRYAGLAEGVNYQKQTKLDTVSTKPDYTFFLPDEHKINMDVKFPLDNYQKMVEAPSETDKEKCRKDFEKNVKGRIKEIQNRDYINPAENTLDFVLLFIPNEQVFGFIQSEMPGLMDEALQQKVVLCSPFTLYAMLSVVRQAFENFRYEKDLKKIIVSIDQFARIFERCKIRFEDIGKSIEKLEAIYSDVKNKSFKQLDSKIKQIEDYKKGSKLALGQDSDALEISHEDLSEDDAILQ